MKNAKDHNFRNFDLNKDNENSMYIHNFNIVLVSNPKIIIDFPGFQTQTQKLPFSGKLKQAQFQKKFLKWNEIIFKVQRV